MVIAVRESPAYAVREVATCAAVGCHLLTVSPLYLYCRPAKSMIKPFILESTGTRLMYSFGLVVFTAAAGMLNSDGFEDILNRPRDDNSTAMSEFCDLLGRLNDDNECGEIFSFAGVYLLFLTATIFYLLMALITMNLKHSKQFRAKIHNGQSNVN